MFRGRRTVLAVLLFSLAHPLDKAWSPSDALAAANGTIAYVTPSRGGSEIQLAIPNGTPIRTLFTVPEGTPADAGIGSLAWSPDGERLAFSSSHAWDRSLNFSDVYVIDRDGGPLMRPTAPPDPGQYDDLQKGKVFVRVKSVPILTAEISVFVEGASSAANFTSIKGQDLNMTFENVADFGDGIRQYVRVFRKPAGAFGPCWGDLGVFADVAPGRTIDAGVLDFSNEVNCMLAWAPTWLDNDTIAALFVEPFSGLGVNPPNNVLAFAADGEPGQRGQRLVDMDRFVLTDNLSAIAVGPKTEAGQSMILVLPFATGTVVYLTPTNDFGQMTSTLVSCPKTICQTFGVAWHPDGESAFFSEAQRAALGPEPRNGAVIYEVDGATRTRREFLHLPNEVIGRIAVSPDGKTVAFERAKRAVNDLNDVRFGPRAQCPCSIWLIDTDGTHLRQFATDGRAPAWAP